MFFLSVASCGDPDGHKAPTIRNVLLISLDTCRADHLGIYGFDRPTTPNIDALAGESIVFEQAVSPIPLTLPAHTSMLTGALPPYHGIHDNIEFQVDPSLVTLAELLGEHGMTTGAVISAFVLDSQFGLDQGFDTYDDRFEEDLDSLGMSERRGGEVTQRALAWLDAHDSEPFFLFLHYYDPHAAYIPPEPFATRFADNKYAGEIAYTDHCVGEVLEALRTRNLFESTLIIVTADHGEMRGEHEEATHGYFVYEAAIRVPLIVRLPGGGEHRRVRGVHSIVDILPTVCGLLEIEVPEQVWGVDLSSLLLDPDTDPDDRFVYGESMYPTKYGGTGLMSVRGEQWKYIQTSRPELYDLAADPQEARNLIAPEAARAESMQDALRDILDEQIHQARAASTAMSDEAAARIEALGYVGGEVTASFDFSTDKEDPKDLIAFHEESSRLGTMILKKQWAEADALCRSMLARRPQFAEGWLTLGKIHRAPDGPGDAAEAERALRKVIYLRPDHAGAHMNLARLLLEQGRLADAGEHGRRASAIRPDYPEAQNVLGRILMQSDNPAAAIEHFRRALRIAPDEAETHNNLGNALMTGGNVDTAIEHYRKALDLEPNDALTHNNLGLALVRDGQVDAAIGCFQRAIAQNGDYVDAHYNLARLLAMQRRVDDATHHYHLALGAEPGHVPSLNNLASLVGTAGDHVAAVALYRRALDEDANSLPALNGLAWALATSADDSVYDPAAALPLARRAATASQRRHPAVLDTLAAACAAAGIFDEAVATAEEALRLAEQGDAKSVAGIKQRRGLYHLGKVFRAGGSKALPRDGAGSGGGGEKGSLSQ